MKTLVIFNGNVLGSTEEALKMGDVITIELKDDESTPLTVHQVLRKPQNIGFNPKHEQLVPGGEEESNYVDIEWEPYKEYDFIAYLSYNEKATKRYKKKTSQRLEKKMAETVGGRTTPGSGAFAGHKGDVKSKEWLGEHKFTDAPHYNVALSTWKKIAQEAFESGKTPIMEVVLDQSKSHIRIILLSLRDFYEFTRCTEEQFISAFFAQQLKPRKNSASIRLTADDIRAHIENTFNTTRINVPAWFLTYHDNTTLMGLRASDFEIIFKDEE